MASLLTVTQRENSSVNATNSINECVRCEKWTKKANTGGIVSMTPMGGKVPSRTPLRKFKCDTVPLVTVP